MRKEKPNTLSLDVLDKAIGNTAICSWEEEKIIKLYRSFNDEGKEKVLRYAEDLFDSKLYEKNIIRMSWMLKHKQK